MAYPIKDRLQFAGLMFVLYLVGFPILAAMAAADCLGLYNPESDIHPGY